MVAKWESGKRASVGLPAALVALAISLAMAFAAEAAVDDTTLVSQGAGDAANGESRGPIAISTSGRFIAFVSEAMNLAPGAAPGVSNVYRRDTVTGETKLVSRATGADGPGADGDAGNPAIAPGGRYVAFESRATDLSDEDGDPVQDVFMRDVSLDRTILVSRASGAFGAAGDGDSGDPSVSVNGGSVAFESDADNLVADADPAVSNVFVRNVATDETRLESRAPRLTFADPPAGPPANGDSSNPSISRDGSRLAFESTADNLSDKDNDSATNIYLRDLAISSTTLESCASGNFLVGCAVKLDGDSGDPYLSADGRFIAFESDADNLDPADDDTVTNVFWRDVQAGDTRLVSRASGAAGPAADGESSSPTVSGEGQGQVVIFSSAAENLSDQDVATFDVFARDVLNVQTLLVSRASGASGAAAGGSSLQPAVSGSGLVAAFASEADNLSAGDRDDLWNVFTRELDLTPPPPFIPPPEVCHHLCPEGEGDHGTGEHVGAGHAAAGGTHAGHGAAAGAHAGHDEKSPRQTLFSPGRQDIDKLYVMVQVHEKSTLEVRGTVSVPGASQIYSFKPVRRAIPRHGVRKIYLKLSSRAKQAAKRVLRRGRSVRAKVTAVATDAAGNKSRARRTIGLKP